MIKSTLNRLANCKNSKDSKALAFLRCRGRGHACNSNFYKHQPIYDQSWLWELFIFMQSTGGQKLRIVQTKNWLAISRCADHVNPNSTINATMNIQALQCLTKILLETSIPEAWCSEHEITIWLSASGCLQRRQAQWTQRSWVSRSGCLPPFYLLTGLLSGSYHIQTTPEQPYPPNT
jgi:hypothetical protein